MPVYEWRNNKTEEVREFTCRIADIDSFLDTVPEEERDDWSRVMSMPAVRTDKLSVTFPDGHVPASRRKQTKDALEAAKLEIQSYNLPHDKRSGINKEIKKLRSTDT